MSMSKAIIIGRLGRDPELKITAGNLEITTFPMCSHVKKSGGREEAHWHNVTVFGKQANNCQKYLHKGALCCVEGRLETRSYEKEGKRHTTHGIVAERVTFLSSPRKKAETDAAKGHENVAIPF
ncbi:MAG: single-stranded DNA-binding protein [Proteobacteria bacterium]|nr:single-stranded DNA-binding protein [Pseudomonadota bacterium]